MIAYVDASYFVKVLVICPLLFYAN
jgi:hypothetical protein